MSPPEERLVKVNWSLIVIISDFYVSTPRATGGRRDGRLASTSLDVLIKAAFQRRGTLT